MPHRYTIKELEEMSNKEMMLSLIRDREESTTNTYSPLNKRLQELRIWINKNMGKAYLLDIDVELLDTQIKYLLDQYGSGVDMIDGIMNLVEEILDQAKEKQK